MSISDEYMSIRQAAEYLQVSYFTVYNHVRDGRIKAQRRGGIYRISFHEVELYRQERDEQAVLDKRRAIRG